MNHPIHPESVEFAGLVMGREADVFVPPSSEYLQGHQDGLEWAAQMAEANDPRTGDWLYDDPHMLAAALRKGPEMPEPAAQAALAAPVAAPFAYFFRNVEKNLYEQVMPGAAGQPGIIAAYAAPVAAQPAQPSLLQPLQMIKNDQCLMPPKAIATRNMSHIYKALKIVKPFISRSQPCR